MLPLLPAARLVCNPAEKFETRRFDRESPEPWTAGIQRETSLPPRRGFRQIFSRDYYRLFCYFDSKVDWAVSNTNSLDLKSKSLNFKHGMQLMGAGALHVAIAAPVRSIAQRKTNA